MNPIEIEGLTKIYKDRRRRQVVALDGLTLQIGRGEVFGFLGPNGAGKSTTIKTLVGLIRADAGVARLFGGPVTDPACRMRVGYLPENPTFYDFLTAREYLHLVGRAFGLESTVIRRESDRVLELLDLRHAERRPIRSFSKGMVQRLGLAQALLHDPDLYILDEPMSGLDPLGRALVKQIMSDLRGKGKTIFFSTHVTTDVEAVCDRVAVIVAGRLRAMNVVRDLLEKGIEGYTVQLSGCQLTPADGFELAERAGGLQETFVSRSDLNRFMDLVVRSGGEIHLMEPRRRDLERFFLDIVQREGQ
jgi:ABC-2 type transport system ATP-binding protein